MNKNYVKLSDDLGNLGKTTLETSVILGDFFEKSKDLMIRGQKLKTLSSHHATMLEVFYTHFECCYTSSPLVSSVVFSS
jgi:hypothetical protein